jgi:hypothetical protein
VLWQLARPPPEESPLFLSLDLPSVSSSTPLNREKIMTNGNGTTPRRRSQFWQLLLLIPFVATLIPQFYNTTAPDFVGIPFFYWYQLLWIILAGVLVWIVYALKAY